MLTLRRLSVLLLILLIAAACSDLPISGGSTGTVSGYPPLPSGLTRAPIVRVVDGDTAIVRLNGAEERIRLIGMNTPESVDPRRPVECFGREASNRAKVLLEGQTVLLENDTSQDNRDRNGRLLRYFWFEDGRLFNLQMIREGYAYEYTFQVPYKYQREFKTAQQEAQAGLRGLWSPQTCNGKP